MLLYKIKCSDSFCEDKCTYYLWKECLLIWSMLLFRTVTVLNEVYKHRKEREVYVRVVLDPGNAGLYKHTRQ